MLEKHIAIKKTPWISLNPDWRLIAGTTNYYVSRFGQVWSQKRMRILVPGKDRDGYRMVHVGKTRKMHQLVLEAFVGPRPEGYQCAHLDGNPSNNRLVNL